MRSSLFKHIWLIQPPDPIPPVTLMDAAGGATVRFSPSWDLLCLQEFLLERTGHTCTLIDTRTHETIAKAMELLARPPDPNAQAVAVIQSEVLNMGPVGAIVKMIHEQHPDMTIVLCGQLVDSFPELVRLIPHVDYGLCGDPELVLRNLLDFIDITHRLKLVPGLIMPQEPTRPPYWIDKLSALSMPEWYRVHWSHYQSNDASHALRVEARLSRGMPKGPGSLAFPKPNEPVRTWSLPAFAQSFQKCAGQGISEIFLADPPEFWTDARLLEWCRLLNALRNTQPWAIQLLPRHLTTDILDALGGNACHRVEFIIPTCDPDAYARYGITISEEEFHRQIEEMANRNTHAHMIYWVQGPGERAGEPDRIYRHLMAVGFPKFALHPFPLHHDAQLYRDVVEAGGKPPPIEEWVAWAQKPDTAIPPAALWDGPVGLSRCRGTVQSVHRKVLRNPRRHVSRILRNIHHIGSVASIEKRIADWFNRRSKPTD